MGGTLYVFLHGLTVAADSGPDMIEIVLPRVPGHVYKAGCWLAETNIALRSELVLSGVDTGTVSFSSDLVRKYMIDLPDTSLKKDKKAKYYHAANIMFPRAKAILPALVAKDTSSYVAKRKKGTGNFTQVATLQILIYDYSDESQVCLKGHHWEPAAIGGAMTLHIISTSEGPEGQAHEDMTEKVMHRLLDHYPGIEYRSPRVLGPYWRDLGDLSKDPAAASVLASGMNLAASGEYVAATSTSTSTSTSTKSLAFPLAELEHPASRALRLCHLGRLKQAGRTIDSLWEDPDFIGERTSNCTTTGGK